MARRICLRINPYHSKGLLCALYVPVVKNSFPNLFPLATAGQVGYDTVWLDPWMELERDSIFFCPHRSFAASPTV
jgi:hypothetical protein